MTLLWVRHVMHCLSGAPRAGRANTAALGTSADHVDKDALALPRTDAEISLAAAGIDLAIPDACMPGVVANLALLDTHARNLRDGSRETGR
ncbi:hypothetical protein IFR23_09370 [Sphingomonas sp. CFBP 13603]|uniref:hypothetical protein n=1 Tax=Sphingomonas sp. CFBP 13603 TaxID=2774040 RepID=UPI00186884DF|nr:hypothetical protein [Sphingomonas sp. CFBP 13603]MBE2992228.1 hypothetical protein [Sphingomonas sp. CFBP 13603]